MYFSACLHLQNFSSSLKIRVFNETKKKNLILNLSTDNEEANIFCSYGWNLSCGLCLYLMWNIDRSLATRTSFHSFYFFITNNVEKKFIPNKMKHLLGLLLTVNVKQVKLLKPRNDLAWTPLLWTLTTRWH